jgi:uncharacterized protein
MSDTPVDNKLDERLVSRLCCPLTRSRLRQEGAWLIAEVGGLAYPIRDGIPVMLVEEARLPEGVTSIDALKAKLASGNPAGAKPSDAN